MNFQPTELQSALAQLAREFAEQEVKNQMRVARSLAIRKLSVHGKKNIGYQVSFKNFDKYLLTYGIFMKKKIDRIDNMILNIYLENDNLKNIDKYEFEELIQRLIEGYGFVVEPTKKTRDGGYDMLAIQSGLFPIKYLVECKTTSKEKSFGVEIIRPILYLVDKMKASAGIVACNGTFSQISIKESLEQKYKLILFDFKRIVDMVNHYVINLFKTMAINTI